jgi:uncharacterized membrane protein
MDAGMRVAELAAGRAFGWIAESFRMFRHRPLQWIGLCAAWIGITFGLLLVPFLGGVVANFLQPVFFAGFAIAAYKQSAGERIAMADLFSGFRRNVRSLVNLGALLLLAYLGIAALMVTLGLPLAGDGDQAMTVEEYVETLQGREWILMVGFALAVVVKGALWFAPPLIAFHGMSTTHAIRWSAYATLANIGVMAVYGVAITLLFFVAILPWGLGLVIVLPLMAISTYVSYREVFESAPGGRAPGESTPG